jgi:hypothetical protein
MLTRESILKANDIKTKKVNVKEWGGDVYIKTLSVGEAEDISEIINSGKSDDISAMALWLVCSICDDKGNLLFTKADVPQLRKKAKEPVEALFREIAILNNMGSLEETAKN